MTDEKLRARVVAATKSFFGDEANRAKVHLFADSMSSFEGWVNWEIGHAFSRANAWPRYTFHREHRFQPSALADLCFHAGPDAEPEALCYLESKLIWRNGNRGKQIRSAARDADRLRDSKLGGKNLLLVMTVSAAAGRDWLLPEAYADESLALVEERIGPVHRAHDVLTLEALPRQRFYCHPRVRAKLYEL